MSSANSGHATSCVHIRAKMQSIEREKSDATHEHVLNSHMQ